MQIRKRRPRKHYRKKFKLNILITQVNEPQSWWFHSCKDCRKGMTPHGNTHKCPKCGKTESPKRYKLSVDAVDIEPNNDDKITAGRFMFYGDEAATVIGKDIALLLAQARSKPNLIPPAIAATVGRKCAVTARVKDVMYDVDEEGLIILDVSKAQLIKQTSSQKTSSSQPTTELNNETPTGISAQAEHTPAKEVVDQPITSTEEDTVGPGESTKRKVTASAATRSTKKSTSSEKDRHTSRKLDINRLTGRIRPVSFESRTKNTASSFAYYCSL